MTIHSNRNGIADEITIAKKVIIQSVMNLMGELLFFDFFIQLDFDTTYSAIASYKKMELNKQFIYTIYRIFIGGIWLILQFVFNKSICIIILENVFIIFRSLNAHQSIY